MTSWIKCHEKMPAYDKIVAVLLLDNIVRIAKHHLNNEKDDGEHYTLYSDTCWYCCENDYETIPIEDVSHWHPLAELPV